MATATFRLPTASMIPRSHSSSAPLKQRRSSRAVCSVSRRSSAEIPFPPVNPGDPFLMKLASAVARNPEAVLNRTVNSDVPPYLDIYDSPKLMATPAQVERSGSYRNSRSREPPPDLPSLLLEGRIVYIGMPLVSAVTELVLAQLMYLQYMDPEQPIYLYINSTGTIRDDGEIVALEYEGFAIYDAMMQIKNEIHTVGVGAAIGQACLLLAAGTKGKRFMLPHAKAMIQQPRVPSTGLLPASDVIIRAREALLQRDLLVELLAKHTGNPVEVVANKMKRSFYMDPTRAIEFGVADKIVRRGEETIISPSKDSDNNPRY